MATRRVCGYLNQSLNFYNHIPLAFEQVKQHFELTVHTNIMDYIYYSPLQ